MENHEGGLGFTWTVQAGWLAGKTLTHGHPVVTNPGGKKAVRFAAVELPPDHPWAEGGRYEYGAPVFVLTDHPVLAAAWADWRGQRTAKYEARECYVAPRVKPRTADEASWEQRQSTLAKARLMTSWRVPPQVRWGERKLGEVLAAMRISREEFADYLADEGGAE